MSEIALENVIRSEYEIGDQKRAIFHYQQGYSHPHNALKEYVSNEIDCKINSRVVNVEITINTKLGQVIVQGDGAGMNFDKLKSIPREVCKSDKLGFKDKIGNKAIGILGFPTCGATKCEIFSKPYNSGDTKFNYLRMHDDLDIIPIAGQVDVSNLPFKPFNYGTRVVLGGIRKELLQKYFKISMIKNAMSGIYSPLLRKGIVSLKVGDGNRVLVVDPLDYEKNGRLLLDDILESEYGIVEVFLFINPDGRNEKIGYYNKGVRAVESITSLDEHLRKLPWNSGQLMGEIDENFLELTASRESPVVRGREFTYFIERLRSVGDDLNKQVERCKIDREKNKLERNARDIVRNLDYVIRDIKSKYPVFILGTEKDPVKNVFPEGGKGKRKGNGKVKSRLKPEPSFPQYDESDLFVEDEGGEERHVKNARRILSSTFEPFLQPFQPVEMRTRYIEGQGIFINTLHRDFVETTKRANETKDERIINRYLTLVISREIAYDEFKKACRDKLIDPIEQGNTLTDFMIELYQRAIEIHKSI